MMFFLSFATVLTLIWALFLKKNRMNPYRGILFILSSMVYFFIIFISYAFMAGGSP